MSQQPVADGPAHRHPLPAVSIAVPRRWVTRSDPSRGVVLAARARCVPPSGFAPELLLQSATADGDPPCRRADTLAALAAQLHDVEVEDTDAFELGGQPVTYRRFAHRRGALDVMCEQWEWSVVTAGGDVAVTLTASVAREDYLDYCDLFEDVAATVELPVIDAA